MYVAKRVEYAGGEVRGLTDDGSAASTLLCFMVKSLTSNIRPISYVSGYIARSVVRNMKCDDCREVVFNQDKLPEPLKMDACLEYTAVTFLNSINRGGQQRLSYYCFMAVMN